MLAFNVVWLMVYGCAPGREGTQILTQEQHARADAGLDGAQGLP